MNELKRLNKTQVAKNAYRLIAGSEYTVEWIALELQISERAIYYWQEGKRTPSMDNIYGLSQLFNVPMESILV